MYHFNYIYTVSQKRLVIFGMLNPEKIWHKNLTGLSTSPLRCSYFTLGNQKKSFIFNNIIHTYLWLFMLFQKKANCNLLAHPTWNVTTLTCEFQNFFIRLKVSCILWSVGGSEESQLWVVIGGSEKNWFDVWQLECHSKCSEWPPSVLIHASSLSTLISLIDARAGVHLVSPGLLQLTAVRHQRQTTSTPAVGAERCCPPGHRRPSVWPHHTSVTAAALAASPSAHCVQDRGARTSVARWSGSRVPHRQLSPSVGRWSSPTAVQFQWHAEAARAAKLLSPSLLCVRGRRSSTVEWFSTRTTVAGTYFRLLQTISENWFIRRPKGLMTLLNL